MGNRIDAERCTLCGMCRASCPSELFEPGGKAMAFVAGADEMCLRCGHCIAACPEDAIAVEGLEEERFERLPAETIGYEEFQALLLGRRSVRKFTGERVAREQIDRMLAAVSTMPTGMGGPPPPVTILDGRDKIDPWIGPIMDFYRKMQRGMHSRVGRTMMRTMMGKRLFQSLDRFLPLMDRMIEYYDATGADTITWGAPLLMIFHAPTTSISADHDGMIACTYAMLAAHAQGLGTTIIGMVPPFVERTAEAREALKIPAGNKAVISLIAGHPASKYVKGIHRPVNAAWI